MELSKVTFANNLPGYLCGPEDSPSGVVLLQEWWGVTDTVKAQALRIAAAGHRCLVPDLYRGKVGVEVEEARHLMANLDWRRALQDTLKAARHLRQGGAKKVAVMGFCLGGALAAAAAQHPDIVSCGIVFYGLPDRSLCSLKDVRAPLSMHFGALDDIGGFSDPQSARSFADQVRKAGALVALHIYERSGHSFLNEGPDSDRKRRECGYPQPPPEDQRLAWERVFDFLSRHLQPPAG